ncbi:MAG: cobyrinate a,c-diamide synthase [Deltaproteobacteria bacterium]|nr:cobyrinate a,c-diamide synthase [Deltaproteobacteria bacterium]
MIPRLVIAGTASGVGKTTITVGLARALRARGLRVALFKCGPDYLDPTYHARAIAGPCHNLDGWMMGQDAVRATFAHAARGADIALLEGVMGLYDGASPVGDAGSTAEIAKWLGVPVVLVCDASGMARSIAALARGFASFDPDLQLAGVIGNRVGSRGHLEILRTATGGSPPVLGGLPKEPALGFPDRHLGLRTAERDAVPEALFAAWGERVAAWIDVDAMVAIARAAPPLPEIEVPSAITAPRRCRIGLAHDEAFHFYYADNLRRLEALGAELVRFSPIHDRALPAVDGLYLGGGYPEVHAAALAANGSMRAAISAFAGAGRPIYAECGGLMYLARAIVTLDGARHPMVGLVDAEAVMNERLQALGYVEVETQARSVLGPPGLRFRGHQFRYSELRDLSGAIDRAYSVRRRRSGEVVREGYQVGSVLGSYVHAHWASNPLVAQGFVERCAEGAR